MNLKSTSIVVDLYCNTCGHKGMIVFLFVVTDKIIASGDFGHNYTGTCLNCGRHCCCLSENDILANERLN